MTSTGGEILPPSLGLHGTSSGGCPFCVNPNAENTVIGGTVNLINAPNPKTKDLQQKVIFGENYRSVPILGVAAL